MPGSLDRVVVEPSTPMTEMSDAAVEPATPMTEMSESAASATTGAGEETPAPLGLAQPSFWMTSMDDVGRRESMAQFPGQHIDDDADAEVDHDRIRASTICVDMKAVEIDMAESRKLDEASQIPQHLRPTNFHRLGGKVPFRVPRRPTDLTPTWLTKAFRFRGLLGEEESVTKVEWKPIGEAGGVMGVIALVDLEFSEGASEKAPRKLIAKFTPTGKAPLPRFQMRAIFQAESHFYNDFTVVGGGLPRPECYLALYDSGRRKPTFCMLLENMMPATSYTRTSGCDDLDVLKKAMGGLASLHARWWGHKKKPPLEWVLHPANDYGGFVLNGFVMTTKLGLAAFAKCYGEVFAPILKWQKHIKRRHKYILRELFRGPLTLCHGDAHIENCFFDGRFAGGCAFIDFGNVMFSQAMYDVAFFMVHSLDPEVRRRVERPLVEHYHALLVANGVLGYDFERCWADYRFNMWRPFLSVLAMGPAIEAQHRAGKGWFAADASAGDVEARQTYEKLYERCVAGLIDHKWLELLMEGEKRYGACSCLPFCF